MTPEEALVQKNRVAATLGTPECMEILKERREEIINRLKHSAPTEKDPNCFIIHYRTGELQAIDDLIAMGEQATKPTTKGTENGRRPATRKLPTF